MATSSEIYNLIVSGNKSLNTEINSLTPSNIITLYELDLSEINPSLKYDSNVNGAQPIYQGVLRIYNDFNFLNKSNDEYGRIKWQNNYYYPFPVYADGFEFSAAGTLPTPRLVFANASPDQSNNSFFKYLRMQIESLGDLVGTKFTRIRTFLKYLRPENFAEGYNPYNLSSQIFEIELPRDVFYVDRKVLENKNSLEYQLASALDTENITLPGRTILANKCSFQYRGENCCYEYHTRLTKTHSGCYANIENSQIQIKGLQTAPPVSTENDQLFVGNVFGSDPAGKAAIYRLTGVLGNSGEWREAGNYVSGDFVFIEKEKLKYYFVCINNHLSDANNTPPNTNYWTADSCAKNIGSCRLRWLKNPAFKPVIWPTDRNGETLAQTNKRLYAQQNKNAYDPSAIKGAIQYTAYEVQTQWDLTQSFPRRPGAENPLSNQAHGLPKDYQGNYLNGFLPFGGFPAASKVS
jgi:lambda family phage minor tail protein L